MQTMTQIKLAVKDCLTLASVIKKAKFHEAFTDRESVFGYEETFEARNKLISDFTYQAKQALNVRHDQVITLKELFRKGSHMIVDMCDEIMEYYELDLCYEGKVNDLLNPVQDINNVVSALNEVDWAISRIETFKCKNYIVELLRTCKALSVLNSGIKNKSFNNLLRKLLEQPEYFKNGYPKDLLCYDAWLVESVLAKSIWYREDYCSTYLDQGEKCPDPDSYIEWPITY